MSHDPLLAPFVWEGKQNGRDRRIGRSGWIGIATACAVLLGLTLAAGHSVRAQDSQASDTEYAQELWKALEAGDLVNKAAATIDSAPEGSPHGPLTENHRAEVTVNGHKGTVAIQTNVGSGDTDAAAAKASPADHRQAVNVMFKREAGYDPDNGDWFWAKYNPDGSPAKGDDGAVQIGKVVSPCTACHAQQKGQDYLFHKSK